MKHIQRFHETESKVQAGLGYVEARKRSNNVQHILYYIRRFLAMPKLKPTLLRSSGLTKTFLIILCALAWSTGAWGEDSYVLEVSGEKDGASGYGAIEYTLSGEGMHLYFNARKKTGITGGNIEVYVKKNGSWSNNPIFTTSSLSTSNKSFNCNIDADVTDIRFKGNLAGTRYFSSVKVIRRTRLEGFSYTTSSPYDMGTLRYGKSTTTYIENITYHVSSYPNTLTGTCVMNSGTESGTFSVEDVTVPSSEKGTGQLKIPITFSPKSPGAKSATVTLKFGTTTVATFKVTGEGADKGTPAFTWNITNAYKNHSYSDFFTSTNDETSYTITSDKPTLGNYVDGKLVFYDGVDKVTFTVTQAGNDDWNAHTESFEVNVTEAQNHLPLSISSSNQGTLVRKISGSYTWDSNGFRLGDGGGGLNWDDKLVEINFEGIPGRISFDYAKQADGASGLDWNIQVSTDGNNWDKIWESTSGNGHVDTAIVNSNARYVRLCYSGNFGGYFRNINISERRYLTASTKEFSFGTNTKGNNVEGKTFTLSHCNAGFGVTFTSSDASFTASPNPVTTTGGDVMGTETITIRYLNNSTGVHNGTITIHDPGGQNDDITLNVSGTTQTTYYTRAVATTAGGGSAYITYDSGLANSTTSVSTSMVNSGLVTTPNASKTVYLRAVPAEGYRFVEWRKDGSQVATSATATKSYTYNSEASGSPTVVTYTAVFEAKTLTLNPASPSDPAGVYAGIVTLSRTLPAGYSTIALPFNTTVAQLTGRTNDGDWVAQLQTVTHTQADNGTANEYTLYFQKVDGGAITANQPYVLHLAEAKVTPSWTPSSGNTITVKSTASAGEKAATNGYSGYGGWVMHANYDVDFSMSGKYGIVNSAGGLMLGGSGSTLAAYTAYIAPPAQVNNAPRLRVAYVDTDGTTTVVDDLPFDNDADAQHIAIYGPDGKRRSRLQPGVNIVRYKDGTVRKIQR